MPSTEINDIIQLAEKQIVLKKNQFLTMEGQMDENIYYVENGSLKIFISTDNNEHIIRFAYRKNLFVILDSFLTQNPSMMYAQAIKKSVLSVITKSRFEEWLNSDNNHLRLWENILKSLILQQQEREIDLLINTPHERISRVLQRSPELFKEIPAKYIANYLRMSPETFSRILAK